MIIYKVINKVNGKIYIGITTRTLKQRKYEHERLTKKTYFITALKKYGKENFIWEIIEYCQNILELNEKEKSYISYYKSNNKKFGYNLTDGGEGTLGHKSRTWTEIDKLKASERMIGNKNPMFGLFGSNNPGFGQKRKNKQNFKKTEKFKKQVSERQKGRIKTEKEKLKIKNGALKYIYFFNLNNSTEILEIYDIVNFCKEKFINYKVLRNIFSSSNSNNIKYKQWNINRIPIKEK